jgi:signal transduction histidine kinase
VTRDSIASDAPAVVRFRIGAPIWQRWWFILAAALFGAAVIYVIYRNRLTKLLELERTRTRIATDLHDDIGANLSKIALLSELVKMKLTNGNEENNRMLATIADVSRSTVDSMRDIVWSINPRRDSVLEMTRRMREHAEETLVPLGIAVEFKTDESGRDHTVPMDMRRELLLIFKEAINNAAKHSGCRRTHIDFRAHGRSVFLGIRDDGAGFDPDATQDNNGLANMRARAEKIGARFSIDSTADGGTTIKVETGTPDLRD